MNPKVIIDGTNGRCLNPPTEATVDSKELHRENYPPPSSLIAIFIDREASQPIGAIVDGKELHRAALNQAALSSSIAIAIAHILSLNHHRGLQRRRPSSMQAPMAAYQRQTLQSQWDPKGLSEPVRWRCVENPVLP